MSWREDLHPRRPDGRFGRGGRDNTERVRSRDTKGGPVRDTARGLTQDDMAAGASGGEQHTDDLAADAVASRWAVADADLAALAAEERLDLDGKTGPAARRAVTAYYIRGWQGAAGGPAPDYAIRAVAQRLGLPETTPRPGHTYIAARPPLARALSSFGEAMYTATQDFLAQRGITEVNAQRAGFSNDADRQSTSWSLSYGGLRHEDHRVYRRQAIPARYIFSIPPTGFGTLAESELVVLPGAIHGRQR